MSLPWDPPPGTMSTRTITIVIHEDEFSHWYDVFEGEYYSDRMAFEEMIGQVISLAHPEIKRPRFRMETPDEHYERRERWKGMNTKLDQILAPVVEAREDVQAIFRRARTPWGQTDEELENHLIAVNGENIIITGEPSK
jgi:hypothetical protein